MSALECIKNNRFSYLDIMEAYHISDYDSLRDKIERLVREGRIAPIKKSGFTSFKPSIYQEYRKLSQKKDYTYLQDEIVTLHTSLAISKYLSNPEQYYRNREGILRFSEYLWKRKQELDYTMSVKERSYAIWGDEKFLESKEGRQICSYNGYSYETLNCFYAPESFFSIDLHRAKDGITALIIENKDTWYSIGRALRKENGNSLSMGRSVDTLFMGQAINLLIYGEGNKATKPGAVDTFMQDITDASYRVYYVGDIDIAGINMLYGCMEVNPKSSIEPFIPLYHAMLKRAVVDNLPVSDDNRGLTYRQEFLEQFNERDRELLDKILGTNRRVPQEILNYRDYLDLCGI